MHRTLMVRRWNPADADKIATIFAEHDRTDFPARMGAVRRTLFGFHDLYFHLIDAQAGFRGRLFAAVQDGRFKAVDEQLALLLQPYNIQNPGMADAEATVFYDWQHARSTPSEVFRVVLEIEVLDTPREQFVAVWQQMAAAAMRARGNLDQSLNVDADNPARYFIVSEWATEEDFRAFSASPDHADLAVALKSCGRTVSMSRMHHVASPAQVPVEAGAS